MSYAFKTKKNWEQRLKSTIWSGLECEQHSLNMRLGAQQTLTVMLLPCFKSCSNQERLAQRKSANKEETSLAENQFESLNLLILFRTIFSCFMLYFRVWFLAASIRCAPGFFSGETKVKYQSDFAGCSLCYEVVHLHKQALEVSG